MESTRTVCLQAWFLVAGLQRRGIELLGVWHGFLLGRKLLASQSNVHMICWYGSGLEHWFLEWSHCKKKFTYASDCISVEYLQVFQVSKAVGWTHRGQL